MKEWNRKPPLSRDWNTFRVHFEKSHRQWKAKLRLTAGQHFPRANDVVTSNPTTNHQSDTVDALYNLATATAADRATVATITDTIAQLLLELASAQAKLISSLLENQQILKRLLERGGSWNTSGGVADGNTSGGGATGPWDGPIIHYCYTHGHKCPHPSFKFPEPTTGHIKNTTKKDTGGGRDQDYKNKSQHNEANNSKTLININNVPLFKSTVYVCHSNSFIPPPLNSKHNDAYIDSG